MIINDPVHGFIEIPDGILASLVKHPYFIRLNRIEQLGPTSYVYPGGRHTRFLHSIGALHLITNALQTLRSRHCDIAPEEALGAQIAMLLHDIGHGPMSHCLEGMFISDLTHEDISLLLMERLNDEFNGKLDIAISIFKDQYPKHFLHELICSQLDMDRLDYLCRDSFFTGVREGNIGAERIIKMLNVREDRLVVESKGIYTIENYLMSRRLMYWQVYLHKTVLAARYTLLSALERAKELISIGHPIQLGERMEYFLCNNVNKKHIAAHPEAIDAFIMLDDHDIYLALKEWMTSEDKVLRTLSQNYINRHLYKTKELSRSLTESDRKQLEQTAAQCLDIELKCAHYFVRPLNVSQMLYSTADDHINILTKENKIRDISNFSELLHSEMVDRRSERYYLLYQRDSGIIDNSTVCDILNKY